MMRAHFDVLLDQGARHERASHRHVWLRSAGARRLRKPEDPGYQGWVEADLIFVSPDEAGRVDDARRCARATRSKQGAAVHRRRRVAAGRRLRWRKASLTNATQARSARRRCWRPRLARRRRSRTPRRRCAPPGAGQAPRRRGCRAAGCSPVTGIGPADLLSARRDGAGRAAGGVAAAAGQHQDPLLRAGDGAAARSRSARRSRSTATAARPTSRRR